MASFLILAVGQDPLVLSTRCSILRSVGYIVRSASSASEAVDLFRSADFDLLLLCHSVAIPDRDRIIRAIRSTGSRVPIYTVSSSSGDFRADQADGILSSTPQDLIEELGAVSVSPPRGPASAECH